MKTASKPIPGKYGMNGTERISLCLRNLYESYGYSHFKMSKFEEYDLYAANKDFLPSDSIITFTDRRGRLLALKPDITLSIIKNSRDEKISRYYYNENVYRIKNGSDTYGELLQLGAECMGDIGILETAEMIIMAVRSLETVSESYVLDVSHMGLLGCVLSVTELTDADKHRILKCVSEKSIHGIDSEVCDAETAYALKTLIETEGPIASAVGVLKERLPDCSDSDAVRELEELAAILTGAGCADRVRLDFSVVHDRTYYNGIVMRGFVEGVPERVLSGGRYDLLMARMGKSGGGVGFSVYADTLEKLTEKKRRCGTDVLVIASDTDDIAVLMAETEKLRAAGLSVTVARSADGVDRDRLMRLADGKLTEVTE